jgi:hypothetical protein
MTEKIDAPVSVNLVYDHTKRSVFPSIIKWDGKVYSIKKVGLHHTFREGRVLYHVFSVSSDNLFFRLVLNTENLMWRLEEISDGMPN